MATKVGTLNNILVIDDGVKKRYPTSAWCGMFFTDDSVIIRDRSRGELDLADSRFEIPFVEFQDLSGTPYTTEADISLYLSDKIG